MADLVTRRVRVDRLTHFGVELWDVRVEEQGSRGSVLDWRTVSRTVTRDRRAIEVIAEEHDAVVDAA